MLNAFLNIFRVPDLRRKVLITLGLIAAYRVGAHVPTPFINPDKLKDFFSRTSGSGSGMFGVIDMFSGGAFSQMSVFALGIMPYISASIIIQVLSIMWPRLEKIRKEGEAGQRKITQWTRYGTVILSLFQGLSIGIWLSSAESGMSALDNRFLFCFITMVTMCTGTCFIMWLGEKITQHGIGNGMSLIIAVGIMAHYPQSVGHAFFSVSSGTMSPITLVFVLGLLIIISAVIVVNQVASRKIPVQHARRMVGRGMTQGGSTHIPLKLNTAGVIPVIFASSLLSIPTFLFQLLPGGGQELANMFRLDSSYNLYNALGLTQGGAFNILKCFNFYILSYIVLTAFFCFFYTAITLNPVELADNLKKSGAFVPGIKPGKSTADFIDHILVRITVVGALLLLVVAVLPDILFVGYGVPFDIAQLAGGTGLIIVIGVFLDTMTQIESQLMMRHYPGFSPSKSASGGTRAARRPSVRLKSPS